MTTIHLIEKHRLSVGCYRVKSHWRWRAFRGKRYSACGLTLSDAVRRCVLKLEAQ